MRRNEYLWSKGLICFSYARLLIVTEMSLDDLNMEEEMQMVRAAEELENSFLNKDGKEMDQSVEMLHNKSVSKKAVTGHFGEKSEVRIFCFYLHDDKSLFQHFRYMYMQAVQCAYPHFPGVPSSTSSEATWHSNVSHMYTIHGQKNIQL